MTYFCYIEGDTLRVPHLEVLDAEDADTAAQEAQRLLATHASGIAAHVFKDDVRILTVLAGDPV